MAVPRRKTSRSRKGHRRSHDSLSRVQVGICPQCNEPKRPHRVCMSCGYYKGRPVIAAKTL